MKKELQVLCPEVLFLLPDQALFFIYKWFYIFYRVFQGDAGIIVINVDQDIFVISHLQLFHISELTKAMTGFHTLYQIFVIFFFQRIYKINRRLIYRKDICGCSDSNIRRYHRNGSASSQSQDTDMLRITLI